MEVEATASEGEPLGAECLMKNSHVVARGRDAASDVVRWSRAELDLTAWLQRQEASSGHRVRLPEAVEDFANPIKRDW